MRNNSGFTIVELLVVIALIAIIAAIAVPNFIGWLPKYRLRAATQDLYSNFQRAKMGAIKNNNDWAIVFDTNTDSYSIISDYLGSGQAIEKTVNLSSYGSGIGFGHGNATQPIPSGGSFPTDNVTYDTPDNTAVFTPRGLAKHSGYAYLANNEGATRAAGTPYYAGGIVLKAWMGSSWQ